MINYKTIQDIKCISPDFIYDIKPSIMLQIIDELIDNLIIDSSPESVQKISRELSTFQILTFNYNDENHWISEPITIHKLSIYYPFKNRLAHFIKSVGQWKSSVDYKDTVNMHSRITLPLYVNIDNMSYSDIENNKSVPMMHTLVKIHHIITKELQKGSNSIGIFKNADIVKNLDYMREWLNHYENEVYWGLERTIRMIDLNSVVHNAIIKPNKI